MRMQPASKTQLVVRSTAASPGHAELATLVDRELLPRALSLEPAELTLHVAEPPPRVALIPFRRSPIALVTLAEAPDAAAPRTRSGPYAEPIARWTAELASHGLELESYRVSSACPVYAERTWPLGSLTPGIGLLTLLSRNPRISPSRLIAEWHGKHTPMSLEIHPLWHYERNVVLRQLFGPAGGWDGIVTEHFRQRADLLRPWRLFGGPLRAVPNMIRVGMHIGQFLDMRSLETYLVSERRIRD